MKFLTIKNKINSLFNINISPQKLALSITVGIIIGISPLIGLSTFILTILIYVLKLNLFISQLVQFLVFPLQLILFIPFIKAGEQFFNTNYLPYSYVHFFEMVRNNPLDTIFHFGIIYIEGAFIWMLISIPLAFFIYNILLSIFSKQFFIVFQLLKKRK